MAKSRNLAEALENHKSVGNNEFFTLADDKDTAIVRFLYSSMDELDWAVVHEVDISGKKRWVECTEEEACPCCSKLGRPALKLFIQMVQKGKEDTVVTWERGQRFIPIMQQQFNEYGDLTQHVFEIERNGAKGDSNTTYKINHIGASPVDMEALPERQQFITTDGDGFILQKTHDEMTELLSANFQYQPVNNPSPRQGATTPAGRREAGASRGTSSGRGGTEVF